MSTKEKNDGKNTDGQSVNQSSPSKTKKENKKAMEVQKQNEELEKKIKELEKQISDTNDKLSKEKDSYVRLLAEFENFRRRTSQEKLDLVSSAAEDTIKGLLPILDDCELAMKALEKSSDSAAAKEGTQLIYNKLLSYLKSKGLTEIEAMGEVFDTEIHEAIAQFPVQEEDKKGKVFDVTQTGYKLNGKVIRFAKVVVGN